MDGSISNKGTRETRYWLLFFIIAAVSIFLVIALNRVRVCSPSPAYNTLQKLGTLRKNSDTPEIIDVQQTQVGLKTITERVGDQTRFRYEYRIWPERSFLDPDNYSFYSLYGWRTSPPPDYPQPTINTAYDEAIRNCQCFPAEGNETCLSNCRFKALIAAGFPSMFQPPS